VLVDCPEIAKMRRHKKRSKKRRKATMAGKDLQKAKELKIEFTDSILEEIHKELAESKAPVAPSQAP